MAKDDLTPKQKMYLDRCETLCLAFLNYLFKDEFEDDDFGFVKYDTGNARIIYYKIRKFYMYSSHCKNIVQFIDNTEINIQIQEFGGINLQFCLPKTSFKVAEMMSEEAIKQMWTQEIEYYKNAKE